MDGERLRILIIDDDDLIIQGMRGRLEAEGFSVTGALTGEGGVERFREGVDVVLLDLALPDISGEEVFRRLRMVDPTVPVIMMTGHSTVTNAVEMMKAGLFHYVEKNADYMAKVVRQVRAATSAQGPGPRRTRAPRVEDLIGTSDEIRRLRKEVTDSLDSPEPMLIVGERGSGKRMVAHVLHHASPRQGAPLLTFDCGTHAPAELEALLFGQEAPDDHRTEGHPGALELARGGTVILDQVHLLSRALQTKLLDYLDTGRYSRRDGTTRHKSDVRVVAITTHNLKTEVTERDFSNALRLALGGNRPIEVPPLRERPQDVPALATYFLDVFREQLGRSVEHLSDDALACLRRQPWPGNVRELKNLIERAVLLVGEQTRLTEADLLTMFGSATEQGFVLPTDGVNLEEVEKSLVVQALSRTNHNRTQAGKLLHLNRDQVRYRINKFGIEEPPKDGAADLEPKPQPRT